MEPRNGIPGKQANIPDKVVIKVEDTGKGIDSEDFDRIFDRFYRAESDGESPVITSYSIHYTKLYEAEKRSRFLRDTGQNT